MQKKTGEPGRETDSPERHLDAQHPGGVYREQTLFGDDLIEDLCFRRADTVSVSHRCIVSGNTSFQVAPVSAPGCPTDWAA